MEYILGRQMQSNLLNNDLEKNYREALLDIGYDLVITYLIISNRLSSTRRNSISTWEAGFWVG